MDGVSVHHPPTGFSGEASPEQLELARVQGLAVERAVHVMTHEVAQGEELRSGDFLIGYAIEKAEGSYQYVDGRLEWMDPDEDENAHLAITVRDAADGRFLPGLVVHATLVDLAGREIASHRQPFVWHPWLYHYGRNWHVPTSGEYLLRVHVDVATFPRFGQQFGRRFHKPGFVEFRHVQIEVGRK